MDEKPEQETAAVRPWRKPGEPMPWGKFWWKDWLSSADARRLTYEQRGRFLDVWCFTRDTDTPGRMSEEDVRLWAGYTPMEWQKARAAFLPLFKVRGRSGTWVLVQAYEDFLASVEVAKTRRRVAMAGVSKRRATKEITTTGPPAVQLTVGPPVDKTSDVQTSDVQTSDSRLETTDKTDSRAQTSRSRAGSAGSAGSSRESRLEPIVARALKGHGPANGGSA